VNYTAGLSKIRTSPDHGTAYDIARDCGSQLFKEAVYLAFIYRSRIEYAEISQSH
jgi:4-hydroxythreonine-4-phosphate dehydrogenase